jgi:signal transduction histidine kinase
MTTMDILARQVADNPQLSASARVIQKATERGAELTQRLLAFARRQPLQPRETDINALIYETEKLLRPLLGVQIDIEVALSADVWRAMVDPNQLSMAIINLTVNARDAMPNGGKLTIETKNITLDGVYAAMHGEVTPGPYALISVSDSGTGIPAALIDKVFEPFFTTKGVGKGTGLGLSMVYGFVKQSGGHVNIDSKEGHGTTVKLYLPRASDADVTQTAAPSAAAAATAGKEASLAAEDGLLVTDVAMRGPRENAILPHERLDPGVRLLAKPYRGADLARMGRLSLQARGPPADQPAARSR